MLPDAALRRWKLYCWHEGDVFVGLSRLAWLLGALIYAKAWA